MNGKKSFHADSETYYRILVEISPDAVLVILPDGKILEANTKAMQFFGLAGDDPPETQSIFDIIFPEDADKLTADLGTIGQFKELKNAEYKLQSKKGSILWGSINAKVIPAPGKNAPTILVLIRDTSEKKIAEESLRNLSVTDDLTGLYNRRGFTLAAEQELKHARRLKEGLVLLFFDLDNLKTINDTCGHAEGDKAIMEAARILRCAFRESDIVARWGGDEFIVLALDVPHGRIQSLLVRIDKVAQNYNQEHTFAHAITFSRGTAHYDPASPSSLAELEKAADAMMYDEKLKKRLQNASLATRTLL
ncbi:MAG: sensor domain-containing diguanylate cyclase [Rectinemataceae bacterium]|nr:sensor domain-containing diguanylate cyclase [Rectinemataceae bacterium]